MTRFFVAAAVLATGCTKSRADVCAEARVRSRALSKLSEEMLVADASNDQKALARRVSVEATRKRDAAFMGLCENADAATLDCIRRANLVFEQATKSVDRTCGSPASLECRVEIYTTMDVEDRDCGDRLLAFEMLLLEAARDSKP